jgi:hypothetical protein
VARPPAQAFWLCPLERRDSGLRAASISSEPLAAGAVNNVENGLGAARRSLAILVVPRVCMRPIQDDSPKGGTKQRERRTVIPPSAPRRPWAEREAPQDRGGREVPEGAAGAGRWSAKIVSSAEKRLAAA